MSPSSWNQQVAPNSGDLSPAGGRRQQKSHGTPPEKQAGEVMSGQTSEAVSAERVVAPTAEEYAELVGNIEDWEVDEELTASLRASGNRGSRIAIDLDQEQTAAVFAAADQRGLDPVRFAKQAVLAAAQDALSNKAQRDKRGRG